MMGRNDQRQPAKRKKKHLSSSKLTKGISKDDIIADHLNLTWISHTTCFTIILAIFFLQGSHLLSSHERTTRSLATESLAVFNYFLSLPTQNYDNILHREPYQHQIIWLSGIHHSVSPVIRLKKTNSDKFLGGSTVICLNLIHRNRITIMENFLFNFFSRSFCKKQWPII